MVASRKLEPVEGGLFPLNVSRRETRETNDLWEAAALRHPPPPSEVHLVPQERRRERAVLRALVVDRDGDRRAAMQMMLEKERFVVDGAATDGAARYALERGRYDLLFVDVSGERERGLSLIEHAKTPRARVTTPVVVATGNAGEPETMFQTLRAGAHEYLPHPDKPCERAGCGSCEAHGWCRLPERLSAAANICGQMRAIDEEAAAIVDEVDALRDELHAPSSIPSSGMQVGPVRHGSVRATGLVTAVGAQGSDAFAVVSDDLGRTTAVVIDLGQRGLSAALRLASARVAATTALERGKSLPEAAEAVAEACEGDGDRPARPGLTLVRLTPGARLVEVLCAGMPAVVGSSAAGELRTFVSSGQRLEARRARLTEVRRDVVRPGEAFLLASDGLTLGALDAETAETLARRITFDRNGASMASATTRHLKALMQEALGGAARANDDASLAFVTLDDDG